MRNFIRFSQRNTRIDLTTQNISRKIEIRKLHEIQKKELNPAHALFIG